MQPPPSTPGSPADLARTVAPHAEPQQSAVRKRVGAWVKARRLELGLSQGVMIRELGYVSRNSVSNVETGREGLPPKRAYAWADLLHVPREPFFRFVTGETTLVELAPLSSAPSLQPSPPELQVLAAYRKLPLPSQKRVRDLIKELSKK